MKVILSIENEFLKMTVFSDGQVSFLNKLDEKTWEMGPVAIQEDNEIDFGHIWIRNTRSLCEEYAARFRVVNENGFLKYSMFDSAGIHRGNFSCQILLEDQWVSFKIFDIDDRIPSLAFPTPIKSESLVIPIGEGQWIRKPSKERSYYPTLGGETTMRWFGGLSKEKGWISIFHEGAEDSGMLTTELSITSVWLKSMGQWQGEKQIKLTFVVDDGYVSLAKVFRNYAKENDLFKLLTDKISDCKQVAKIVKNRCLYFCEALPLQQKVEQENLYKELEGPAFGEEKVDVSFTHQQVKENIELLESFQKSGLIQIGGWPNLGYDGRYPDVWPFESAVGTEDEFFSALHASEQFTIGIHDNYQDIYRISPSFPKGIKIMKNGQLLRGGIWGNGQQAYILNSRDSIDYQNRNWSHIEKLEPQFVYIDTVCATSLHESFEDGNRLTRAEDLKYKQQLLQFYKNKNIALGTETGADFGAKYVDWVAANHKHTLGVSIPLWSLVFHDAVVSSNGAFGDINKLETNGVFPSFLKMMLWGHQLHFFFSDSKCWDDYLKIAEKTMYVDEWFQEISCEEMISHKYLTENGEVEETVFSSGKSIRVNFTENDITIEGTIIPGYGFVKGG